MLKVEDKSRLFEQFHNIEQSKSELYLCQLNTNFVFYVFLQVEVVCSGFIANDALVWYSTVVFPHVFLV